MGLTDALVLCEESTTGRYAVVNGAIGPKSGTQRGASHSRESSTSSTASSSAVSSDSDAEPPIIFSTPLSDSKSQTLPAGVRIEDRNGLLEARLEETKRELERSRAECGRLAQIRDDVEAEVRELTASLFQEAHIMVNAANVKAAASEKALKEARMQVEVLSAEVDALKTLVLTSTPSQPNAHLHPQLSGSLSSGNLLHNHHQQQPAVGPANGKSAGGNHHGSGPLKMFTRHRRGASDCDLKYPNPHNGDAASSLSSSPENKACPAGSRPHSSDCQAALTAASSNGESTGELDPILFEELESWRRNPSLDRRSSALMRRLFEEDADRCLDFPCGGELSAEVRRAVENNSIYIEEIACNTPQSTCALLNTPRVCRYRIKLGDGDDGDQWHPISSLCRNRITAVCDMLTYLRYIQLGLVKSPMEDVYWEVMRLRKQMTLARLGLS